MVDKLTTLFIISPKQFTLMVHYGSSDVHYGMSKKNL